MNTILIFNSDNLHGGTNCFLIGCNIQIRVWFVRNRGLPPFTDPSIYNSTVDWTDCGVPLSSVHATRVYIAVKQHSFFNMPALRRLIAVRQNVLT